MTQGISFACSWLLLLVSTGLVTSAVVNLTLVGSSRLWLTAGGAGAIGILVTLIRATALWRGGSGKGRARARVRVRVCELQRRGVPSDA